MSTKTYAETLRAQPGQAAESGALLRRVLQLDAVVSGANGAVYLAAAGPLGDALGISTGVLRGAGVALLAFAAMVWLVASRRAIPTAGVSAVLAINAVWVAASAATLAFDWLSPTTAGAVWVWLQALAVAALGGLQAYARAR